MYSHARQNGRHSAYQPVFTTVEYRWHPLFGRRLRVREGARRGRFDIVLVEDRPGRRRELPRWMCDPLACAGMNIGPPRVALDALLKLVSVLQKVPARELGHPLDIQHPRRSPVSQHRPPSPSQLSLIFEPDRNQPPKALPSAALLEALAELLLAAMGTPTLTTSSRQPDDER